MLKIESCVLQEEEFGCTVACIATILQESYYEVEKYFITDFKKEGITSKQASDFLSGFGFSSIWAAADYFTDYRFINEQLLRPFAEIHLVSIKQFSDYEVGHALIMTNDGTLYCPHTGEQYNKPYLTINSIFGFWYPPNWDFRTIKEKQDALGTCSNSGDSGDN